MKMCKVTVLKRYFDKELAREARDGFRLSIQHPPCFFIRRRLFAALFSCWKSVKEAKDKQYRKAKHQTNSIISSKFLTL